MTLAFFLEQFKKCDEVTYLNDTQVHSFSAERETFIIEAEQAWQINDYLTRHDTSVFMLFMTALAAYVSHVKMNAEKFYIGTAVINRTGAREKNTAGMFINTVPMLLELDNERSFSENLSTVEEMVFSVFRHQKYNYGDVLADVRREFGFTEKLYDVILSYQNAAIGGEVESTWYHSGMQTESLQIHIDDRDGKGIFRIHYDYQTEKFTAQEIERMHRHILTLLVDAINDDGKKLCELEILSASEKRMLLCDFNDTAMEYPRDKCIHQLFEEQVTKTPDKTAVIACDGALTYAQLNEQANRIAHGLIALGIGAGEIVAFALPRKSYLLSVMFGILKISAAYMPIDPDYPQSRIDYMIDQSGAKLCIDESNITDLLNFPYSQNINASADDNSIFCALHTSGSTGNPKLSLLTQSSMMNFIAANHKFWENTDTVVSATIVTFDAFQMESVLSIAQGHQLVLASNDEIYNQVSFETLFRHSAHNMFFSTPTKIESYIDKSIDISYLCRIRSFVIGGEVFHQDLLNKIEAHSKDSSIYNIYGPTETTICAVVNKLDASKEITIGKPIANTQIYIVDKHLCPTPIGVVGELCIAGDGVGAGYLHRPELTTEKFIDNPFGEGKLYKTGDLAYWREDGNIVYVGRNDFQVKVRGLRIELEEIETAIDSVEGVSQSVVVVRKDTSGRQLICAFYTESAPTSVEQIKAVIRDKLPRYMMPHIFTQLSAMPLTSSGKVNRKALPEVDLNSIETSAPYVPPQTERETTLTAAIEAVLGLERVGILDHFFDIGGDSLKAIELIAELSRKGYTTDTNVIKLSDFRINHKFFCNFRKTKLDDFGEFSQK